VDFGFKVSACAKRDLANIWRRVAKDSPANATKFCDELLAEAESLTHFPHRHGNLRGRPQVRKLPFAKYLIVYLIDEDAHVVEIARFWHAARDQRHLRLREEAPAYEAAKVGA
jgi:plasmid stabilization system protein ParE